MLWLVHILHWVHISHLRPLTHYCLEPWQTSPDSIYQYHAFFKSFKSNIWTIPLRKLKGWVQIIIYFGRTLHLGSKCFKIWGLKSKHPVVLGIKWYYKEKMTIFWFDLLKTLNSDPVTFGGGLTFSLWFHWLHLGEGLDRFRFTVELDDIKGLFQTKLFCDSIVLWLNEK